MMGLCAYCDRPAGLEVIDDDADFGTEMVCAEHAWECGIRSGFATKEEFVRFWTNGSPQTAEAE